MNRGRVWRRTWTAAATTILFSCAAATLFGANERARRELPAKSSRGALLNAARQRAVAALAEVGKLIDGGGAANAQAWRTWLGWNDIDSLVAAERPDCEALAAIDRHLRQNVVGLERPEFIRLRHELRSLAASAELADEDRPEQLLAARRETARRLGDALGDQPPHVELATAAALADWLSRVSETDREYADAVKRRYSEPNATFRVSRRLLDYMASRVIAESRSFSAFTMGAETTGVAITRAKVGVQFVPNEGEATVNLTIRGSVAMPENVSTRRRVAVYSSSDATMTAAKRVTIHDEGLRPAPAEATARANVSIEDVSARLRFIERAAWRRAESMRPQAASDTARRIESEIETRADELSKDALDKAHTFLCQQVRTPLVRLDALPERFEFSTTGDHLKIVVLQRRFAQLASAVPAPEYHQRDDLAFRVHESFLNNLAESVLPGVTVKDRVWMEMLSVATGSPPRALWVHDRAAPWSVTFAESLPVSTRVADGAIRIVLRFDAARRGDDHWTTPIEVETLLEPRMMRDGPALFRRGGIAVRVSPDAPAANDLQRFLERKFSAVFPEELHFDGLVAPEGGALGKLRSLALREFDFQRGWITLGYQLEMGADTLVASGRK
ncbi:MAG: hypothetical protein DCC68_04390 [Planctomycetota bacterium]|nr:MAG: hypothetical protein DCC68_04390 [Planctomycetota bacterium]